ncbi:hypothetical protein DRO42_08765 [Candidatus Bathyarchaeota archaeon]|nr:MAG: hypothetical protein DRO42_08765 [Candidatus Bathyarchaeota archaeon]
MGACEILDRDQYSFEELVLSTVARVLVEVFGETGASFIYSHLRRRAGLEKERIPWETRRFREGIVEMLGSGGIALLNRIIEKLAAEIDGEPPRGRDLRFEDKLRILNESYLRGARARLQPT